VIVMLGLTANAASAAVINVPADYATIQEAIDAAVNGDTVLVQPGTYVENINFGGKAITLTSTSADDPAVVADTILDGNQAGRVVTFNHGEGADSVLTGLTIRNGKAYDGGGILCSSSSPTITKNRITGNSASGWQYSGGGGIYCVGACSPTIEFNAIEANSGAQGGGITCRYGASPLIGNNAITGNTSVYVGGGINGYTNCTLTITNNTISDNQAGEGGGAIGCRQSCSVTISDNTISTNSAGSGGGVMLKYGCSGVVKANVIENNRALIDGGGLACRNGSSPEITGNVIENNRAGQSAGGIRIAGASSPTIVGNKINHNVADAGGAICLYLDCSPEIRGNEIKGNTAVQQGGGIYYVDSSPVIAGNTISNNQVTGPSVWAVGGGIRAGTRSRLDITGNTITGNSVTVGSSGNLGGGIWTGGAPGTIRGNIITGNTADHGGGIICCRRDSTMTGMLAIDDNTISGNSAGEGAGIYLQWSAVAHCVEITANTIEDNFGDGIFSYNCDSGPITGNVISGNTLWGIKCEDCAAINAASLEHDNTLGPNGSGQVLQCWRGLVKVIFADGSPAAGASVSVLDNDGDMVPDYGSPFTSSTDGFAPDTADPADCPEWPVIPDWPVITEFKVSNDGVRHTLIPQTMLASLGAASGTSTHSWNGRCQIAEVVLNRPPVVGDISGPTDPVSAGTTVYLDAEFTDPDVDDAHVAVWDWGDGREDTVTDAQSPLSASQSYSEPGVYPVSLTVTDIDGAQDRGVFEYVVVYDSSGGFVTGGGWIDSPSGAYVPDSSLTGKANFGFVSKYKKGADVPEGETEFRFRAGDLNFHSTEYQWLVIAGPHAKFKGRGAINAEGDYGFMVTATDGDVQGGGGEDTFRIKITDGDGLVYDNKMGEPDDSNAGTEIGGGSIVVHKAK